MIDKTFETPGPLSLDLVLPSGAIEVETAEGTATHVTLDADSDEALEQAHVELHERGRGHELVVGVGRRLGIFGGVFVQNGGGRTLPRYRLRVTCPPGARLTVKTVAAEVDARGTFGDTVLKTVSGDTAVERVAGELRATSVSGDLVLAGERSVAAKTVSGDVRLEVESGGVNVTSVSGDIEVAIRRGSRLHVDADSVTGTLDSELELSSSPGEGEREGPLVELRAKTVSGDFRVRRGGPREPQPA